MKENFCSICGEEFKPKDLSIRCRLCLRNYHARCWEKTGGCTTYGCPGNPELVDENCALNYVKCPGCGEEIFDFAVRCPFCRISLGEKDSLITKQPKKIYNFEQPIRKDPILAGLLNLIFPGAGYMYLGLFTKGLIWFLIAVAAWYFTRGLGLIAVYLWVMYDSSRLAVAINRDNTPPDKKTMQRR
ncbi:MAG: RING finger protein [Bacillota bacterium]|nr:RING finger protein [Bacillota bacterium]